MTDTEDAPQTDDIEQEHPIGLGIDIGGTGIKAALVDLVNGQLVSERLRIATPKPASPDSVTKAIVELVAPVIDQAEVVGVGFPAVVRRGVALSAVNVTNDWLYADLGRVFGDALGRQIWAINDSDAAGLAEARLGAGRHHDGTVVVTTLGTGVGTSLIVEGRLVPNVELGLLSVRGKPAGDRVANSVRKAKRLSWRAWAMDLERFIAALDQAVAPDLVIIGGGVSREAHRFLPRLRTHPIVLPARLRNDAGIVGAALYALDQVRTRAALPPEATTPPFDVKLPLSAAAEHAERRPDGIEVWPAEDEPRSEASTDDLEALEPASAAAGGDAPSTSEEAHDHEEPDAAADVVDAAAEDSPPHAL